MLVSSLLAAVSEEAHRPGLSCIEPRPLEEGGNTRTCREVRLGLGGLKVRMRPVLQGPAVCPRLGTEGGC